MKVTKMKITNKIIRNALLFSSILMSLIFVSCENLIEKESSNTTTQNDKTYLTISCNKTSSQRSIKPDNFDVADMTDFKLEGTFLETGETNFINTFFSTSEFTDPIEVLAGEWSFTFSAQYNGHPYSDTVKTTIRQSQTNLISFNLKPSAEEVGFSLFINIPELTNQSNIDTVKAYLKNLSGTTIYSREYLLYKNQDPDPDRTIVFEKVDDLDSSDCLQPGTYSVKFEFYTGTNDEDAEKQANDPTPVNTWESYLTITSKYVTAAEITLNFNEVYTIKYFESDGTTPLDLTNDDIEGFAITKYSARSSFDLLKYTSAPSGKVFAGWQLVDDIDDIDILYDKIEKGTQTNLSLKAYFADPVLYVSDNYNEDDSFTGFLGVDTDHGFNASHPLKTIDGACEKIYKYGRPEIDWIIKVNGSLTGVTTAWPWKEQSNIPAKLEKSKHGNSILLTGINPLVSNLPQDMINRGMNRSATTDQSNTGNVLVIASDIPVTITNLKLTHGNRASSNTSSSGGAIRVESNATLYLGNGVWLHDNYAKCGGGIFNLGTLYIYGTAVIGDKSKTTIANGYASVDSSSCYGSSGGGGIYNLGRAYLGYDSYVSETNNHPVTWEGGIYYNYAVNGGAIYNASSGILYMNSGNLAYNASGTSGTGGGAVFNLGSFTMTGGLITNNDAKGSKGGGVNNNYNNSTGPGIWTFAGGSIKSNKASDAYGYSSGGGGVANTGIMYVYGEALIGDSGATDFATGENNCSNYAAGDGGGVLVEGTGKAYFGYKSYTSPTVNETVTWSGGIYYNYAGTDTSSNGGGGIAIKDGKVYMHTGTIAKNGASKNGNAAYVSGPFYLQGSPSIIPGADGKNNIYLHNYTNERVVWLDGPLSDTFTALITPDGYQDKQAIQLAEGANTTIAAERSKFSITPIVTDDLGTTEEWEINGETGKLKPVLEQLSPNNNGISIDIGYNTVDLDMRPDGTYSAYSQSGSVYTLKDTSKAFKIYLYNSGNYQDFVWILEGEQISTADNIIFGGPSGLDIASWAKGNYDLTFECTRKQDNLKYSYSVQIKIQ